MTESWKKLITGIFGRKAKHKTEVIMCDVLAVELHLKPSFLFDHWCINSEKMVEFLSLLRKHKLVTRQDLVILDVEETIFLTTESFLQVNFCKTDDISFIDVSHSLDKPRVLKKFDFVDAIQSEITSALKSACDQNLPVVQVKNLSSDINRTTLFGLLLGYPVVYWYDSVDPYDCKTCLDMVPLQVYKVKALFKLSENEVNLCCYSFSIPQLCLRPISALIDQWYERLFSVRYKFIENVELVVDVQTLDTVVL